MNIFKVLPSLKKKRHMAIWHKALRQQWSAEDLNWSQPQRITRDVLKDHLARILTPVLMGEQSALYSVSGLIPIVGHTSEVETQLYLTTWAVDEARHTELFARFYQRLGREPMSIRKFPSGYLFQSAIASKEISEWLGGVLVSEVLAKLVMEEFRRLDLDPLLSDISHGILEDEARHLVFNHIYMEDRFQDLFQKAPRDGQTHAQRLRAQLQKVLNHVPPIFDAIDADMKAIGVDRVSLYDHLCKESLQRLEKSIDGGRRLASGNAAETSAQCEEAGFKTSSGILLPRAHS